MTVVWWNGRFVRAERARASVLDRGLLYADGAFETLRLYAGEPFALEEHLARLAETADVLGLAIDLDAGRWRRRIVELARRNGLSDTVVRLTVTRGAGGDLGTAPEGVAPSVLLHPRPLPPGLDRKRRTGIRVTIVDLEPAGLADHKTLSLTATAHAKRIAIERGAEEALLRARDGTIPEGATSNLFVVDARERLRTHPLDGRALPGITRALVLRLADRVGVEVHEEPIELEDLLGAAEAFVTSSVIELLPIRSVDGAHIGTGRGPITGELARRYAALRRAQESVP